MLREGGAEALARMGLESVREAAAKGADSASAALAVADAETADALRELARLLEEDASGPAQDASPLAPALYALAAGLDEAAREREAALLLAALAGLADGAAMGMLGLATIALRRGQAEHAHALASAALRGDDRHPRAMSLLGVLELERGRGAEAQALLAAAARLARRNPLLRDELRIAQRALLLMHLKA